MSVTVYCLPLRRYKRFTLAENSGMTTAAAMGGGGWGGGVGVCDTGIDVTIQFFDPDLVRVTIPL
jgi:hypothetical protein